MAEAILDLAKFKKELQGLPDTEAATQESAAGLFGTPPVVVPIDLSSPAPAAPIIRKGPTFPGTAPIPLKSRQGGNTKANLYVPPVSDLDAAGAAAGDALSKFFSTPYGYDITPDEMEKYRIGDPITRQLISSSAIALDLGMRVMFAPVIAGAAAVKGIAVNSGMTPSAAQDLEDNIVGGINQVLTMSMASGIPTPAMKVKATALERQIISQLKKAGAPTDTIQSVIATMNGAKDQALSILKEYPNTGGDQIPPIMPINPDFMVGYHGTPHKVKGGLKTQYALSGEGSMVRGAGHYIAENPDVAKTYVGHDYEVPYDNVPYKQLSDHTQNALDLITVRADARKMPREAAKASILEDRIKEFHSLPADTAKNSPFYVRRARLQAEIDAISNIQTDKIGEVAKGNLYKVDLLPGEHEWLDLDKTLAEQSPFVKQVIDGIVKNVNTKKNNFASFYDSNSNISADTFYKRLSQEVGGDRKASDILDAAGIAGNRFLDKFSRRDYSSTVKVFDRPNSFGAWEVNWNSGRGFEIKSFKTKEEATQFSDMKRKELTREQLTSNYVVFNDKNVKILEENDQPYQGSVKRFAGYRPALMYKGKVYEGPTHLDILYRNSIPEDTDFLPSEVGVIDSSGKYIGFDKLSEEEYKKYTEAQQGQGQVKGWDQAGGITDQPRLGRAEATQIIRDAAKTVGYPLENILISPTMRVKTSRAGKTLSATTGIAEHDLPPEMAMGGVHIRTIVSMALDTNEAGLRRVAFHEFFHGNQQFFTPLEKDVLSNLEGRQYLRNLAAESVKKSPDHPEVLGLDQVELEAYAAEHYTSELAKGRPVKGLPAIIDKAFRRLYAFLYEIKSRFNKAGITAEDVLRQYATGGMKGRVKPASEAFRNKIADAIDTRLRSDVTTIDDITDVPQFSVKGPVPGTSITPKIRAFADDVFRIAGVRLNPHMAIIEQVMQLRRDGKIQDNEIWGLLQSHKVSLPELQFAGDQFPINRDQVKIWQQGLARLNRVQTAYNDLVRKVAESGDPQAIQALKDMVAHSRFYQQENRFFHWYKQLDSTGRALALILPKTLLRNFWAQGLRITTDSVTSLLDIAIQRPMGWVGIVQGPMAHPMEAVNTLRWMFAPLARSISKGLITPAGVRELSTNSKLVNELLSNYAFLGDKLTSRYNADILEIAKNGPDMITRGLAKLQGAAHFMNVLNRINEYATRRAKFIETLDTYQIRRGSTFREALLKIQAGADPELIFPASEINKAVVEALDFAWSRPAQGPVGKAIVGFVNNVPFASVFLTPYPTFWLNALRFVFEHSPAGYLRLLDKDVRAKIRAGDTRAITKPITGALMYHAAKYIRSAQPDTTRWDQTQNEDGTTISWSPFNPFTGWLFLADLEKRMSEGRVSNVTFSEFLTAFGLAGRSQTGIQSVDNIVNQISGLTEGGSAINAMKSIPGQWLSRFVVPLELLKDIWSQFDPNERKQRDIKDSPLLGPSMRNIPGVSQLLPEAESPTREATPTTPFPLANELSGLLIQEPKNSLEKEIDRLGFKYQDVSAGAGDPEINRFLRKIQGVISERKIMPRLDALMSSEKYISLGNRGQAVVLDLLLKASKQAASKILLSEAISNPNIFSKEQMQKIRNLAIKGLNRRMQLFLQEKLGDKWKNLFGE